MRAQIILSREKTHTYTECKVRSKNVIEQQSYYNTELPLEAGIFVFQVSLRGRKQSKLANNKEQFKSFGDIISFYNPIVAQINTKELYLSEITTFSHNPLLFEL